MNRYSDWILTVLCWDGALPLAVFALPRLAMKVFPGRHGLMELTALVIPICAFFFRGAHGFTRYRNGGFRFWQTGLFVAAILLLALCDTVFILFVTIPNIAQDSDWHVLWVIYLIYVTLMAITFFPARTVVPAKPASISDSP